MRYDTPIFLQWITEGEYNPSTGNYEESAIDEKKHYASVTDSGAETLNLIYGEIRQGVKTVRVQGNCTDVFDYMRIGRKQYRVDFSRELHNKHVFVVSEVQNGVYQG